MRYLTLILILFCSPLLSQNEAGTSLATLENFSAQFGIQFAYSPEQLDQISLSSASNLEELRAVFLQANVAILEISEDRWLLKINKGSKEKSGKTIQGQVIDASGEALVSALIYTSSGESSALTDKDGKFIITLGNDESICCQYLGYQVECLDASENLNFKLVPIPMLIENINIETKKVQCSFEILSDAEILRLTSSQMLTSSLGGDVMRAVQLLGGVDATNDMSASLTIRATSGLQSLVTLDGIPLYNPESAFGMFSVLNPLVVTQANLYKNSMPLEYGEFTGGYLACEGLASIKDGLRLNMELNTLQTLGSIQVPLSKNTQISAAFRRSNGRISNRQYYSKLRNRKVRETQLPQGFERPLQVSTSLENSFGDLYFNFSHEWNKSNKLSLTLFGNRDISGTSYEDEYPWEPKKDELVEVYENYEQSKSKANVGLSLRYTKQFKSEAEILIMYYSSLYNLEDDIKFKTTFTNDDRVLRNNYDSQIRNNVRDRNLKFQFMSDRKKLWSWKVGLDLRILNTDFGFRSQNISPFRQKLDVPAMIPYLGIRYNYKNLIIADLGIRNAVIPTKNIVTFSSPRSKVLFKLTDELHLKSSASINQQYFRPIELERQLGQSTSANVISRNIPILRSGQVTLGLNYFENGFKLNGDLFFRINTGILEQVLSFPGLSMETDVFSNNRYELFEGVNRVAGFDITSGYEKGPFTGLLSYNYSKSEDRFKKLFQNRPFPDQNNRTHQLNLFGAYEYGSWTFSSTFIYGSGTYTLDRIGISDGRERNEIQPEELFKQLPSYRRWDIGTSYKIKMKNGTVHLDASIYNLADNNNVNAELYVYSLNQNDNVAVGATEVSLLSRIWSIGVRYQWAK